MNKFTLNTETVTPSETSVQQVPYYAS